jgi:hypothetical protein
MPTPQSLVSTSVSQNCALAIPRYPSQRPPAASANPIVIASTALHVISETYITFPFSGSVAASAKYLQVLESSSSLNSSSAGCYCISSHVAAGTDHCMQLHVWNVNCSADCLEDHSSAPSLSLPAWPFRLRYLGVAGAMAVRLRLWRQNMCLVATHPQHQQQRS